MNSIYFPTQHLFLMICSVTVRSEPEPVNMIQINFVLHGVMWFPILHIAIFVSLCCGYGTVYQKVQLG